jgi:undecaprenyl pyrophosphate synthase
MITLDLPETLEKHLWNIVRDSYNGDLQAAVTAFLHLHAKYGWKEQFIRDIKSIREAVHRQGGIKERVIEESVKKLSRTQKMQPFPSSFGRGLG